jgi:uncharacterized protein (DUF362 family)
VAAGFSATSAGALLSIAGCGTDQPPDPATGAQPAGDNAPSAASPVPDTQSQVTAGSGIDLAVARGPSPTRIVEAAVAALGGIEAFVKPGDDVVLKPNIVAADHSYEYASYTNPEVVAAVTALCVGAGAGRVRVMDHPAGGTGERIYARSGIGDAVAAAGGEMEVMSNVKFQEAAIPEGRDITSWPVYADVLNADVLINLPIAKHHGMAKLTLSMKNLLGVVVKRNQFHRNLGQRIADLTSLVRPELTILDAVNVLMARGPRGGNLNDVQQMDTVIASRDIVAAGSYATRFWGKTGADIDALRIGAEMGLGELDPGKLRVEEIAV